MAYLPLLLTALLGVAVGQSIKTQSCFREAGHEAIIQPDAQAFIAGFFGMHGQVEGTGSGCGELATGEMQSYEAIRWALDRVNKKGEVLNGELLDDYYVPGVKIGMVVRDYCSNSATAVSMAQELFPQFASARTECQGVPNELMLGMIGAANSGDTKDLAKFAESHNLPLISYKASAPELSNTEMYPNFMRTTPPDGPLTQTIVEFVGNIGWKYVVVVYTDNSYGRGAYNEIRPQLAEANICLTAAIAADPHDVTADTLNDILKNVIATDTVGVIYLGNYGVLNGLLLNGEQYDGAGQLQWVVTDSVSTSDTFPGQLYPRGLISIVPAARKVIEFEDHWVRIDRNDPSPENPWYKAMYMERNKCFLPGEVSQYTVACDMTSEAYRREEFVQDQFVEPAVHAVYTYARALKMAHTDLCGSAGMCDDLRQLSTSDFYQNYLRNVDFLYGKAERVESLASYSLDPYLAAAHVTFTGNDIVNPSFEVYNFNDYPSGIDYKFQKVGSYINNLLEIITVRLRFYDEPRTAILPNSPISNCPTDPCMPCLGAIVGSKYLYIPGDIILNSMFSVHKSSDKGPLVCGEFDSDPNQGIQYVEAMVYALNYINNDLKTSRAMLRGVSLGALGFDDCQNPVLSNQLITEVQRYGRQIFDHNSENLLDPRTIEGYLGGADPKLGVSMAYLMNQIHKPMMGYKALTETLSDTDMFPYFMRSHYSITVLARAVVLVAKRNAWQYIQSVYQDGMYWEEYNDVLIKVAAEEGICVVASYVIQGDVNAVVSNLRSRADVQPVVVLADHAGFRTFMQSVKSMGAGEDFQLISTVGDSKKSMEGFESETNGMITVRMWAPPLLKLIEHLENIDINNYMTNPWIKEWYESFYDCSLVSTSKPCPGTNLFKDADFELNPTVISIIYGMYAFAYGLDDTLIHYCGSNYDGLCGDFLNARDKTSVLLMKIRQVSFPDNGNQYLFTDTMGNIPFRYYNYDGATQSFTKVGDYKPYEDYLYLEDLRLTAGRKKYEVASSCTGICMECLYMFRYQKFMYIPGDILIPGIFDVHYRGDSPYSCAGLRAENGFLYTEAFRFALERINSGTASVKLNGVQLGGLGFDGCTDPIRASALVTGIYSGAFPKPGTNFADIDLNLNDLAAWLSYDSDSTVSVANFLQQFGIPAVSPGATTSVLNDKTKFTTFFRTIPSSSIVAEGMAKLSRRLGFDYIITLNAPEGGSREAVQQFRMYAQQNGICIGASYEFETDGDSNQILGYVLDSTTKVIAVFASPDRYISELLETRQKTLGAEDIIFITDHPWTIPVENRETPVGTISFSTDMKTPLLAFQSYLRDQIPTLEHANPWIREFYENYYLCNLAGSVTYNTACIDPNAKPLTDVPEDIFVIPTINAVYAIAEAIHRVLQIKCGTNYNGVCTAFISESDTYDRIMESLDLESFQDITDVMFKFIEREANRGVIFKRFHNDGHAVKEGSFSDGVLDILLEVGLTEYYRDVPAQCVGQCLQCDQGSSGEEEFMYISGDIHIAALFDVHKEGSTPFTCGEINDVHGFQLMEAFNWAMQYINQKQGIFKDLNIKIGSLVFDTCSSPVRAGNLVANYHARNFEIKTTEYQIDPSLIHLYIGPLTSEASIRVADVLTVLGIPQISYGASSLELRDSSKYHYFMRTVPADDKQARAIIAFLKQYEFSNVQIISQFSTVGKKGREEFLRLAPLNKICVSSDTVIGHTGEINEVEARDAIQQLLNKPDASVVILWMDDPFPLLREANKFTDIVGSFSFIGTDKWGFGIAGFENLQGLDHLIADHKVITFDVETADFPLLDKYLEDKTPRNYFSNPWFKDYFEHAYNCSMSEPGIKYANRCPSFLMGYSRTENYIQDPYVLYVINAAFSTALGIHNTLIEWCGPDYNHVCNILRTNGERRELILRQIKKINFMDQTLQDFFYTDDGESDRGYHVYEPLPNEAGTGYYWEDIGSYNDTDFLKMDARYDPLWDSSCDRAGSCECEFPEYQPSRYMKKESPLDLNIVFVSDIHKPDYANPMGCGAIDTGSNMQNLMAFLYGMHLVNENADSRFPSSLKLGGVALDTCTQPSRIGRDVYSLLSGEPICGTSDGQVVPPSSVVAYIVRNSANSIAASSMLSPLKVTTMSMSATSVELNDKLTHNYFLRTVPPDNVQAVVVGEILQRFGWDYVSVVYADNTYGRSAVNTLLETAFKSTPQSCIGRHVSMPLSTDLTGAKAIIDQLNQQIGAKVVVLFVTQPQVRLLLQATTEKGLNHRFIWIGSDTWANNVAITQNYEETASGAITIQIRSEFSKGFLEFMQTLSLDNRQGIPDDWFEEIYQTLHECRILNSVIQKSYTRICTGDEVFTKDMVPQDPFVLHTIIAVHQIAYGLSEIEACKVTGLTIASCLSLQEDRRQMIYDGILSAQHNVLPDDLGDKSFTFKFTGDGYGDIGYNILNFRRNLTSGQYEYISIGSSAGDLKLNVLDYKSYSFTDRSLPASRCPIGSTCICHKMDGGTYELVRQTGAQYYLTDDGKYADPETGQVVEIEGELGIADRFRDIWAIIVVTLAALGAFAALCMFVYLLIVYPVRGGTTIVGYMLCFGIILMYILVFAFIVHASEDVCALRRFGLGFVYSIVYAALFVKLVDCWRTKNTDDIYDVKYKRIGSAWGLFACAVLLVVVQVMINAEWLILEKPDITNVIYINKLWPRCTPDDFYDKGLILSNVYVMFLMFLSVMVGLAAFGNEKNHWDCRWNVGCVVLTIPAWMVWCLVASLGEYKMRDAAVAIGLLFNATVMLLCGPMRKLYLLNKYQMRMDEEEKKSQLAVSQRDYNSMYDRHYDNVPQLQDSDDVFVADKE